MTTELDPRLPDPPVAESDERVHVREFATARRGYDRKQVDEFLAELDAKVEGLEDELHQARADVATSEDAHDTSVDLGAPDGAYAGLSARLTTLFSVVEREAESMLEAAKTEAAEIVSEARNEADRIHGDARREAARSIEEARASLERADRQAGQMLSLLAERRSQMLEGLQQMQARLIGIAEDLELALGPKDAASAAPLTLTPAPSPANASTG